MSKPQRQTIYIGIIALIFFFVLSLVTDQWGFFLWSLLLVPLVSSAAITNKHFKKTNDTINN
ncbi:hypothetical protein DX933_06320 [Ornithinibacillus gellani]|uniref:hypothetical protein n=1 Tax=Ornithinibacillus gellani TaxID=2293253 RepID=UPI000F481294|nr:hypothetical protein [Ornithinibacillus gellani]TQS75427.1 hypothetical protein DX933_06320 [Ornithinibacillus gellani]